MEEYETLVAMDEDELLEKTAEVMLDKAGLTVLDAARLALELREALPVEQPVESPLQLCRHVIRLGTTALVQELQSITFRDAVEKSLLNRAGRRSRTLAEIRQFSRRILRHYPDIADTPVRSITPELCRRIITGSFPTLPMQRKARRLLHAIFSFCMRHGWCAGNPASAVDIAPVQEKPIEALTMVQVRRLLATARRKEHLPCAGAVGLMLWAGIRPVELTRLRWEDVDLGHRVVTIEARHSKTGGARHVTLHSVLLRWLRETVPFRLPHAHIVPTSWIRRWRALRVAAGFNEWNPDALRHTFASYHLKYFADLKALQIDMGHADTQLLRTRYLGMRGVTSEGALEFWGKSKADKEACTPNA